MFHTAALMKFKQCNSQGGTNKKLINCELPKLFVDPLYIKSPKVQSALTMINQNILQPCQKN